MSIHKSLRLSAGMNRVRNVMKREERIGVMKSNGTWKESSSVFGLPKTKIAFRASKKKGASAEKEKEKK